MSSTLQPAFAQSLVIIASLILIGCGKSDRDALAERLEPGIAPEHSTDPDERRAVAESLAADVLGLQTEADQLRESDADTVAGQDRADAARTALIDADCAQMRLTIEVLRRRLQGGVGEPPADPAGTQTEIEILQKRIAQNCS